MDITVLEEFCLWERQLLFITASMLEAIAVSYGFNPEGGTKNYSFSTYDSHSELCTTIKLSRGIRKPKWGYFLRTESFYNVATAEEMYAKEDPRGKQEHFHERSHGESLGTISDKKGFTPTWGKFGRRCIEYKEQIFLDYGIYRDIYCI